MELLNSSDHGGTISGRRDDPGYLYYEETDEGVILSDRKFAGTDVLATSYALAQESR